MRGRPGVKEVLASTLLWQKEENHCVFSRTRINNKIQMLPQVLNASDLAFQIYSLCNG